MITGDDIVDTLINTQPTHHAGAIQGLFLRNPIQDPTALLRRVVQRVRGLSGLHQYMTMGWLHRAGIVTRLFEAMQPAERTMALMEHSEFLEELRTMVGANEYIASATIRSDHIADAFVYAATARE